MGLSTHQQISWKDSASFEPTAAILRSPGRPDQTWGPCFRMQVILHSSKTIGTYTRIFFKSPQVTFSPKSLTFPADP